MNGLLPAAIQDRRSGRLLMLGYMSRASLETTLRDEMATFYSRSRQRLWMKGETSGSRLRVCAVYEDCDGDALLAVCDPEGPTCHLGATSCFGGPGPQGPAWLAELSAIVAKRAALGGEASYTRGLLAQGVPRIAQKVGEEGVELALAAVSRDLEGCAEETADLIYHLTVLMQARGFGWDEVVAVLRQRDQP